MNWWEKDFYKKKYSVLKSGGDVFGIDDCVWKDFFVILEKWVF